MIAYLTKIENGKTSHFRVTVNNNGIDITEGVFYSWLNKYFKGCGNEQKAKEELEKLVAEKLNDGYKKTVFKEILENSIDVYDKAKWHFQGNFPKELDNHHAYIHTGIFLGWLIDHDFVSAQFIEDHSDEIEKFKQRELTAPMLFSQCCDGVLMLEDISETGNQFGLHYYDFKTGDFLKDYEVTLASNCPTVYHVADTWDNYNKMKNVMDMKLLFWEKNRKKSFWKFW